MESTYWITGLLGFTLAVSPFIFSYTDHSLATVTSFVLGVMVMSISYLERVARTGEKWEYLIAELTGFVVVASPFIFKFDHLASAMWASIILGILLMIVSSSKLYLDSWDY